MQDLTMTAEVYVMLVVYVCSVGTWNKIYRDRLSLIIHSPCACLNCGNLQFATETFKSVFC